MERYIVSGLFYHKECYKINVVILEQRKSTIQSKCYFSDVSHVFLQSIFKR